MDTTAFLDLAHELVDADKGTLSLDDRLADVGWDSLSDIEFLARADAATGVPVDASRLSRCSTLRDVLALVASRPS